jgi:hypothetical protein
MNIKYVIVIALTIVAFPLWGQRHYKGVGALEVNTGSRLSGTRYDPVMNGYYSKYFNYRSYYKVGLEYFRTSVNIAGKHEEKMKDFSLHGRYAYTLIAMPNMTGATDLFFNVEGGAFIGLECFTGLGKYGDTSNIPYVKFPDGFSKNQFVLGPSLTAEMEVFLMKNVGVILHISEYWTPFSKVEKWHTTAVIGLKFLIY